jgi:hypothetical protein
VPLFGLSGVERQIAPKSDAAERKITTEEVWSERIGVLLSEVKIIFVLVMEKSIRKNSAAGRLAPLHRRTMP